MSTTTPDGSAKRLCFVIGPIGPDGSEVRKHADFLLRGLVRHVLEGPEFGYTVKRADEDADPGMISDRMISDVLHADLVVADLTGLNANAFYELGIRHSREKPVIQIARAGTELPFDNAAHRTIMVDVSDWSSIEEARKRLAMSAKQIENPDYQVSNPITQANASFKMRDSADPLDKLIADMQTRLDRFEKELSYTANVVRRQEGAFAEARAKIAERRQQSPPVTALGMLAELGRQAAQTIDNPEE